jgi:sugar phosphate isomerase/epimerase
MHDIGFVSAILAEDNFEEVIDFAANNHFKCVEIMCWPRGKAERRYAGVTHIDISELDDYRISYIKEYLQKRNIYISGLGYYPNILENDPEKTSVYIEHLKGIIKAAAKLNIPVVNTFVGRDPHKNLRENIELFKKVWPDIVKVAEDHGIKIGIENCPMLFTYDEWPGGKNLATSPATWDIMFDIIPSKNFGLNYDPSHLVWQHMDYIKPIYDYKEKLHHVHLKDAKIFKEKLDRVGIMATPLEYHSPKLPGLGDVDWQKFFKALTEVRYKGPVVIEVEDKAYEKSREDIEEAIIISRKYLSRFLL